MSRGSTRLYSVLESWRQSAGIRTPCCYNTIRCGSTCLFCQHTVRIGTATDSLSCCVFSIWDTERFGMKASVLMEEISFAVQSSFYRSKQNMTCAYAHAELQIQSYESSFRMAHDIFYFNRLKLLWTRREFLPWVPKPFIPKLSVIRIVLVPIIKAEKCFLDRIERPSSNDLLLRS